MNNLYEQKYKEALGWMQKLYDGLHGATKEDAEHYFPELKENEDEKIRKQILSFLKEFECDHYRNLDFSSWIAWLEKQGECVIDCPQNHQDSNRPSGGIVLEDFNGGEGFYKLNLAYLNKKQVEEVEEMVREWNKEPCTSEEDIKDCIGLCLTDADEQRFKNYHTNLRDCLAWLEKQGEQKTNTDVPTREVILSIWDLGNEWKEITNGCISTEYGTQLNYIQKHWHESEYYSKEKQGEQILANSAKTCKIELKFKAGDWVVHKFGFVWHVDSFDKKNYQVSNGEGDDCYFKISKQDEFHLWTIDDAKDGDVLVCDSKYGQQIGIVKRYVGKFGGCDMCFKTYCFVDWEGNFLVGEHIGSRDIHPATKEQRVLLFQKMKEAGYEWDYIDNKLLYLD